MRFKASFAVVLALVLVATTLFLPGAKPLFAQSENPTGFMVDVNNNAVTAYVVRRGDTLSGIARAHNTDVSTLLRLNPQLSDPNRLIAGQTIWVPAPSGRPPGGRPPGQPPVTPLPPAITLAYIHMISLGSNGPVGCGDRVAPVLQEFPATNAPLRAVLERLLSIRTQTFEQTGLFNALWQSRLSIASLDITNRVATIRLNGQIVMSGTCDGPRIQAQLEQAALQFSTISQVRIFINGNTLQSVLGADGR
jgi:LysM repeat protein